MHKKIVIIHISIGIFKWSEKGEKRIGKKYGEAQKGKGEKARERKKDKKRTCKYKSHSIWNIHRRSDIYHWSLNYRRTQFSLEKYISYTFLFLFVEVRIFSGGKILMHAPAANGNSNNSQSEWAQGARTRLCLWLCELWMLCVCAVGNKYPFVTWCVCLLLACVFLHGERTLFSCGRFYTNYSIDRFCDRFELWQYALRPLQTFCEKFLSELETKRFQWNEHTNNKDGYLLIHTI